MENTEKTPQERLDSFISDNKITLKTQFVPFSFSRNSNIINITEEKDKLYRAVGLTLNWNISLSGNKEKVTTEFSKGIGHLKYEWLSYYYKIKTVDQAKKANELLFEAVENGTLYNTITIAQFESRNLSLKSKFFPTPDMAEILYGMVLDADSLNHHTFESWANEWGGNPDSIKDKQVYEKCREISVKFLKIIGGTQQLQELREILNDLENEPKPQKNKP